MRTDLKTGAVEVLTERFGGKRYNSPNDVCVDTRGRIWFTDPYYGEDRQMLEQDAEAIYRIDPDGAVIRVLSQPAIERPNGLAITPDDRTLYVIDSHPRPGGNRKIWAFDVAEDGSVQPPAPGLRLRQGPGRRRHAPRHPRQPLGCRRNRGPPNQRRRRERPARDLHHHTRRQARGPHPHP